MAAESSTSFFQTVKEKAPLDDYLTKHLNVELVPNGPGRMAAVCPFHEEDTPSFVLYESDGTDNWQHWHCFGACAEGGSVIDAVLRAEPSVTDAAEAAEYLNELYDLGLEANSEAYQRFRRTVEETRADKDRAQEEMSSADSKAGKIGRAYLHNRGYSDETIEHFELGVDTSTTKAGRLAIPLLDKAGHPISIANRALFDRHPCAACGVKVEAKEMVKRRHLMDKAKKKGEPAPFSEWGACPHCEASQRDARLAFLTSQHPKYLFGRDFDKANLLYHEYSARGPLIKDDETVALYLVEGYADVWAGWQAGHKAICSYNGAVLSDEQARRAAELAMRAGERMGGSERSGKPIVLVPDTDQAGQHNIDKNIRKLRAVAPTVEISVVHGIDSLTYRDGSETKPCKDLGEVLQHHGAEEVSRVLREQTWPAGEWQIRQVLDAKNPKSGEPFYSKVKQMELIAEVLSNIRTREALDHLVPLLSDRWNIREEQALNFFYSNLAVSDVASAAHLFKDVNEAAEESALYLADGNVIPLGFDDIDACFPGGGVRPGQLMMMLGKSGTGKAQPLDAKVLTPDGWKLMGGLEIGDEVINPEGGTARIVGVFPQGERDIYRVTFSDGSSTECDLDHLWRVRDSNRKWKVRELGDIARNVNLAASPHHIPMLHAPDLDRGGARPLDAYLLGALLGDAGMTNSNVIFSCAEEELLASVAAALPDGVRPRKIAGENVDYGLTQERGSGKNPLTEALRGLGVYGHLAHEKFIPEAYLWAPAHERLELLRGLMDTDGSVSCSGGSVTGSTSVELGTSSPRLAADIVFLVQSLGGTARTREKQTSYRAADGVVVPCRTCYRVRITMPDELNPFRLARKAQRFARQVPPTRRMQSIEFVGRKPAQCIALDSVNKLYVTDDFIVTHNTMLASQMLANMADRDINCLFFSLEQGAGSFFPRLATQALDMPLAEVEELIKNRDPQLDKVKELYKNMYLIDNVPTETREAVPMTPEKVQSIIQEANLTHFEGKPVDVVIIDHLGILEVSEDAPADVKKSETAAPGFNMKRLFAICKKTGVFMIVLQQLPKQVPAGEPFGMDAGWGGSSQTNFCDYICQIWRPEQKVGIDDTERLEVEGQYKLALGKNRFGASTLAHLFFDKATLRILPPLKVVQPAVNEDGVLDFDSDEVMFPPAPENGQPARAGSEIVTKEGLEALAAQSPDSLPVDTHALLASIGASADTGPGAHEDDPFGDSTLGKGDDLFDIG